jgi:hypothetical protein
MRGTLSVAVLALVAVGCLAKNELLSIARAPADLCRDPGTISLHRLNRAEYNNTVRDLLGDATHPADDFPADDSGYGFDNIADVLAVAPLLVEKYDIAAENLVGDTLKRDWAGPSWTHVEAEDVGAAEGARFRDWGWIFFQDGEIVTSATIAVSGTYELSARAFGIQAGPDPVAMELRIDGQALSVVQVRATEESPAIYAVRAVLSQGPHTFGVRFTNPYYRPEASDPNQRDRSLVVDWIELGGPFDAAPVADSARRSRIMTCDPGAIGREKCARAIFASFGRSAWRRSLTSEEIDRLVALADVTWKLGDTFDAGIGLGMQAILLSPSFVFRVEIDVDPSSASPHPLDEHELAARLSYFLWSSTPDAALLDRADKGELSSPAVVAEEVRRMLADPKAQAIVDNFGGQWLNTRALPDANPDYILFPSWDHELQVSMEAETKAFFHAFVFEDRSALDMLDADFTFVNDRLARHYGEPLVGSSTVQRVTLVHPERGGLFGQGTILTVTSHPRRTSPVKRGKWVLDNLLCEAPPPPPPGIPPFPEQAVPTGTVRQIMEEHRNNPICASCHALMDPIGFGLENFDAIGAWRTTDSGFPIDATGMLPDGRAFDGSRELASLIKADPNLSPCLVSRVMIYALGRGPTDQDVCSARWVTSRFEAGDHRFSSMLEAIALSAPFTWRKGGTP